MDRRSVINLHLYFSGVSLFLLLLFILSGSLHLFGVKEGEQSLSLGFVEVVGAPSQENLEKLLNEKIKEHNPNYKFDYIKGKSPSFITRPTTRTYYKLKYNDVDNKVEVTQHIPNFNKRLMEFHKGHGPLRTKKILAVIALIFALAIFTGLWLGLTVKSYRKITLLTSGTSLLIVLFLFNL